MTYFADFLFSFTIFIFHFSTFFSLFRFTLFLAFFLLCTSLSCTLATHDPLEVTIVDLYTLT